MYTINMDTFILLVPSIAFGVLIGLSVKRIWLFIALLFITPVLIAAGIYFVDIIHMQSIGRGYNESWAGLVIPFLSAGSFMFLAPTALGAAGLKWILSRKRNIS